MLQLPPLTEQRCTVHTNCTAAAPNTSSLSAQPRLSGAAHARAAHGGWRHPPHLCKCPVHVPCGPALTGPAHNLHSSLRFLLQAPIVRSRFCLRLRKAQRQTNRLHTNRAAFPGCHCSLFHVAMLGTNYFSGQPQNVMLHSSLGLRNRQAVTWSPTACIQRASASSQRKNAR